MNSRACQETLQIGVYIWQFIPADQVFGLIKVQRSKPWRDGDVGDGIFTGNPVFVREFFFQNREQTLSFADIALAWARVFDFRACEFHEETHLAEHRTQSAHLEHEPLDDLGFLGRGIANQLASFLSQINQDGSAFEKANWCAVRAVWINDRGDFVVGVQRQKLGAFDVRIRQGHEVRFIGQTHLFERNGNFHAVWGWE